MYNIFHKTESIWLNWIFKHIFFRNLSSNKREVTQRFEETKKTDLTVDYVLIGKKRNKKKVRGCNIR